MSDTKLFQLSKSAVTELEPQSVGVEKSLQTLIERYLPDFLGIRFLASEYSTGKTHAGRIDTLGVDENGCPVIIEYKRAVNENVINQGLFYLDWLLDHKAEFQWLVMEKLGKEEADKVEWSSPRLLCIAGDFTKYDEHAVQQINRNIELIRHRRYGGDLLLLELTNATTASGGGDDDPGKTTHYTTVTESLAKASDGLKDLFESLNAYVSALGDDVQMKTLKYYFAFRRMKNFACVEVHPQAGTLAVYVKVNPAEIALEKGFTQDVRNTGHYGTGDLKIVLHSEDDLEKARPLILQSYEAS